MFRSTIISLFGFFSIVSNASAQTCVGNPVAVQILGSGGPAINPERASAGYLLWVGAQARLLFDIGGGSYIRFGQTRAKLADLAMVGISHLHPDHTSDLAALMWGSNRLRVCRAQSTAVSERDQLLDGGLDPLSRDVFQQPGDLRIGLNLTGCGRAGLSNRETAA